MALGSWPATRLRAMEAALGCLKLTHSLPAMLKERQSRIPRSVACSICILVVVGVLMVAEPLATVPPWGRAQTLTGASAPVMNPAAARPLVHLSEGIFNRTAVIR